MGTWSKKVISLCQWSLSLLSPVLLGDSKHFLMFYQGVLSLSFCLGQVIRKGEVSCCWICTTCKENEYMQDEFTCRACDLGWWPNHDLTGNNIFRELA